MTEAFQRYLTRYISLLTEGQKEYFIAIVDVDKESAQAFEKISEGTKDYEAAWFERKDYSRAVQLRNNKAVSRIVLLSNDSVKMIDSLKDFVEYPAIPENGEMLWSCLEAAFERKTEAYEKKILSWILIYHQISVGDMLSYLNSCTKKDGTLNQDKLNAQLYLLDIWHTKQNIKSRQTLQKMIRYSEPQIVESRLMRGIAEGGTAFSNHEKTMIMDCLSSYNIRKIFQTISYDRVEGLFQGTKRVVRQNAQEQPEEQKYSHSYQYAAEMMEEADQRSMNEVEDWLLEQEDLLKDSRDMFQYPSETELREDLKQLRIDVEDLAFSEGKKTLLRERITRLEETFFLAMERGRKYTPACLSQYAESQKELIEEYFALLGICVADAGIAQLSVGTGFVNRMQNLFCKWEKGILIMPFYHPVCGFYYLQLKNCFEENRALRFSETDSFGKEAVKALMDQQVMQFPIRHMLAEQQLYQLDYTCLIGWKAEVHFTETEEQAANSWVNVRLLNDDLMDYIERQKFLPEIRVTIVDINDISEIMSMLGRLKNLPGSVKCMVHKVILNIVSGNEEKLKQQLQESLDMDMEYPQVLFRFARELYLHEGDYNLERMIDDSDLLFLADSSILYQKPRFKLCGENANWIQIRLEALKTDWLLEEQQKEDNQVLEVLWDSIHHMELEEEVKLVTWNAQELKPAIFSQIRRATQDKASLTIVVLSSNQQLLQHIHHMDGFQVRKSILPGQEMLLVNFHKGSNRKRIQEGGDVSVTVALKPLLEELLGVHEIKSVLYDAKAEIEDPYLTISYQDGLFYFLCEVVTDNPEEAEERADHYRGLTEDIFEFSNTRRAFRSKLITMLYERTGNYGTALMIDYLNRVPIKIDKWEYREKSQRAEQKEPVDIMEILAFQNMMKFLRERNSIDEYTVNRFLNQYRPDMLRLCLRAEREMRFLEEKTVENMNQLDTRVEKKDEQEYKQ